MAVDLEQSLSVARVAQISIEYIIMEVDCKLRLTEACGFGLRSHGLLFCCY